MAVMFTVENFVLVFLLLFTFSAEGRSKLRKDIKCSVCEVVVHHISEGINATTETHTVQTAFRIDTKKRTPYARTEYRILEIIDNDVLNKLKKYNIKLRPKNDTRSGKKLVRVAQHKQPSKKVQRDIERVFDRMMDDHSEEIVQFFRVETTDVRQKVCVDLLSVCESITGEEDFKEDLTAAPPPIPDPVPNITDVNGTSGDDNVTSGDDNVTNQEIKKWNEMQTTTDGAAVNDVWGGATNNDTSSDENTSGDSSVEADNDNVSVDKNTADGDVSVGVANNIALPEGTTVDSITDHTEL